jgi:hypothetical protein
MQKSIFITAIGVIFLLSACSQQTSTDKHNQNDNLPAPEQQSDQIQKDNNELPEYLKLYENTDYKFKAKMFSHWDIQKAGCPFETKGEHLCDIFFVEPGPNYNNDPSDRKIQFTVSIYKSSTSDSILQETYAGEIIQENDFMVGNKNGREYIFEVRSMIEDKIVKLRKFIVKTGKYTYVIHSDLCDDEKQECDRILSGFVFAN